jgi:hypothetical protein
MVNKVFWKEIVGKSFLETVFFFFFFFLEIIQSKGLSLLEYAEGVAATLSGRVNWTSRKA